MLTAAGINSFKFFMAYKGIFQVSDEQMLAGFRKCKELGAIAQARCEMQPVSEARSRLCKHWSTPVLCYQQVHAENGDAVVEAQQRTYDAGITGPEGHAISRPAILEVMTTCTCCSAVTWHDFVDSPSRVFPSATRVGFSSAGRGNWTSHTACSAR